MSGTSDRTAPGGAALVGSLLAARLRGLSVLALAVAALGAGVLGGHAVGTAGRTAAALPRLARDFEPLVAAFLLLVTGVRCAVMLGDETGPPWLHPLRARGLPPESWIVGVVVSVVIPAGLIWLLAAAGYRAGEAIAGVWNPGPSIARLPVIWSALLAVGVYGGLCGAIARSRSLALGLGLGFPVIYVMVVVRYVLAHPDLTAAPLWLRLPGLLMPPVSVDASWSLAAQYSIYSCVLLAGLVMTAPRWVGRTA